jgi:ferritin-like protein
MPDNSATFHEAESNLKPETRDMHRAIVSLMEELEAIDWYQQRIDAVGDGELREILRHNRNEEMEHAAMVLEWIRRRSPEFDERMRPYLYTKRSIVSLEDAAEKGGGNGSAGPGAPADRPYVTIGSMREDR